MEDIGSDIAKAAYTVGTKKMGKIKMARNFPNWLNAYSEYASFTEAPEFMHYWIGVTLIAALLGRRVWWDRKAYKVYPNFYLLLVGPPEVIKKTTTLGQGTELLKMLEDFHLGPSTLTWQALIKAFKDAECTEEIYPGVYVEMSNMFIASGEMGSFINPEDRQCMDMLVKLWDGEEVDKITVGNGSYRIEKPLLSFVTCTNPSWIRNSIPQYMIDGGLLSRVIALYGDKRSKRVASPELAIPKDFYEIQQKLVNDLEDIRLLRGDIVVTPECVPIIDQQYNRICDAEENGDSRILRRKQTQILKLAMILAAATNSVHKSHLLITPELLLEAEGKIDFLEDQRKTIFKLVGKSRQAVLASEILELLEGYKKMDVKDLYKEMFNDLPNMHEFGILLTSMEKAGLIKLERPGGGTWVSLGG